MGLKKNKESNKKLWASYSTVGLMFPVSIAVGGFIGYYLDKLFKTSPILLIVFVLYGIAAGFYNLIKVNRYYGKNREQKDNFKNNH